MCKQEGVNQDRYILKHQVRATWLMLILHFVKESWALELDAERTKLASMVMSALCSPIAKCNLNVRGSPDSELCAWRKLLLLSLLQRFLQTHDLY